MSRKACLFFVGLVLVVHGLAVVSVAQSPDRVELFAGYSYVDNDFSLSSQGGMQGWNAAGTLEVAHHVGVTADFAGYYPNANVYTYLFGPQVSFEMNRVRPFAHVLFGRASVNHNGYLTSQSSFSSAAGGGVDFGLTRRFAVRGQVDWLHTQFGTFDGQGGSVFHPNVVRISPGLVVRF